MNLDESFSGRVEAARRGNRAAFERIAAEYSPHVEAVVRREMGVALRARFDPKDLAQDVWERALRSIGSFRGATQAELRAWLASMAAHVVGAHARRAKARGDGRDVPLDAASGPVPALAATNPSPSRVMRRRERSVRLESALASLSPDHRRVIELARLEGLAIKDVAERMGRTPNATSMLLLRALKELKAIFGRTESLSLPEPAAPEDDDEPK